MTAAVVNYLQKEFYDEFQELKLVIDKANKFLTK